MPSSYCTFTVCDLLVGIEVERVQEVLHNPKITSVPLADESVLGLLNLRGQIVTAIDARSRLGLIERKADDGMAHVIIPFQGEAVSLVVDAESDVVEVEEEAYEDVPETMGEGIRGLVTGIYKLKTDLLLVLDADQALSVTAI
jgi:purine-binding chemotaxis protein CheW